MTRFDPPALYKAMNEQREARGLSWQDVARETGVAASTLTRTQQQGRFEVDGALAMTNWLGRRAWRSTTRATFFSVNRTARECDEWIWFPGI